MRNYHQSPALLAALTAQSHINTINKCKYINPKADYAWLLFGIWSKQNKHQIERQQQESQKERYSIMF